MRRILAVAVLFSILGCAHDNGVQLTKTPSRETALAAGFGGSHAPGSTGLGSGMQGALGDPSRVPPKR